MSLSVASGHVSSHLTGTAVLSARSSRVRKGRNTMLHLAVQVLPTLIVTATLIQVMAKIMKFGSGVVSLCSVGVTSTSKQKLSVDLPVVVVERVGERKEVNGYVGKRLWYRVRKLKYLYGKLVESDDEDDIR
ncbi:hypothetical protein K501DRAFT_280464 [Backusella circina FSU 941]|nr:hypothetical protein K501DRAFT_280464 [Backusella circina FSU 941]